MRVHAGGAQGARSELAELIRNATSQPRPATHRPPISGFPAQGHSPAVALFARAGQTPRRLSRCRRRLASSSDRSCRSGPSCGPPPRRRTGLAARTAGRTAAYCGLHRHDEDGQGPAEAEACSDSPVVWNLCPIGLLNQPGRSIHFPHRSIAPDGRIEVRCLNGGAWDHSTHLSIADDYDAACALAGRRDGVQGRRPCRPRPERDAASRNHALSARSGVRSPRPRDGESRRDQSSYSSRAVCSNIRVQHLGVASQSFVSSTRTSRAAGAN